MNKILIFLLLSSFVFSGCSNLGQKTLSDSQEDSSLEQDTSQQDEEFVADDSAQDGFSENADDSREDSYFDDQEQADQEEFDAEQADEESSGGFSGFFKRLFSGGDKSIPDEVIPDEEGYEVNGEDEDIFDNEDEQLAQDDDQDSENESTEDRTAEEMADNEESSGGFSGFFKRLFSSDDSSDDQDSEDDQDFEDEYAEDEDEVVDTDQNNTAEFDSGEQDSQSTEESVVLESGQDTAASDSQAQNITPPAVKNNISLQKIRSSSYRAAGYLVNSVYIARENQQIKDISQVIYKSDQSQMFYDINPHLKSRSVEVGDKVYYSSPYRTQDDGKILFYYDEVEMQSSSYRVLAGQNIREVAFKLLGHANSWKEIWATNPELQSKGVLLQDTVISYFPASDAPQEIARQQANPEMPANSIESNQDPSKAVDSEFPSDVAKRTGNPFPELNNEKADQENQGLEEGISDFRIQKASSIMSMLEQNKTPLGIGFIAFCFLVIVIRILVGKRRKEKDFDYTKF